MKIRAILFSAVFAVFIAAYLPVHDARAGEKIAVLMGSKGAPFEEVLKGLQGYLGKAGVTVDYDVHRLEGSTAKAVQAVQAAKQNGAKLIVTLGSLATDAAVKEVSTIPIVACMVLHADTLKKAPNETGVGLEFPLEVQFSWLQVLLPRAHRVGVIYNAGENQSRIETAGRIMQSMGLTLVAQEVHSAQEVPAALDNLAKRIDVLWGVADAVAMTPHTAKNVLLFSIRNNIPLVGISPTWVKAGALYSLDWDYADMGAQAGDMAARVLKGIPPATIPAVSPRKVYYVLNLKTAQQMKIIFSDQIIKGARATFSGEK